MPQLHLNFTDIPVPEACLWEQFDDDQKQTVVEVLARLILKATGTGRHQEETND